MENLLKKSEHKRLTTVRELTSEKRKDKRRSFYWNEIGLAEVVSEGKTYDFKLMDLSSGGMKLSIKDEIKALTEGETVEIKLPGVKSSKIKGRLLRKRLINEQKDPEFIIAIETLNKVDITPKYFDLCEYYESSFCAKEPLSFGGHFASKVISFTPEGMIFKTDAHDRCAIPGVILSGQLQIPFAGTHNVNVEILAVSEKNESILMYAKILNKTADLDMSISSTLLASGSFSVSELKKAGFKVGSVRKSIRYTYRKNENDFRKIMDLRLSGAHSAGRWLETKDSSVMEDKYDNYARHLMAYCGSELVSAGRLVFNNGNKLRSEHTGYGVELPNFLWKGGFLEISRLVVEKDFRGADIFLGMMAEFAIIAAQNNIKYLVLNCVDSLVPVYQKFGAKKLGKKFYTEFMEDQALNLLYIDINQSISGKMNFVAWSEVSDIKTYLTSTHDAYELKGLNRVRFQVLSKFSLIGRKIYKSFIYRKNKSKKEIRSIK